jgi:hypothetical protein
MNCPNCHNQGDHVTDKRNWEGNGLSGTKRRRECLHCGERYTTLEVIVTFGQGRALQLPGANGNGNGHKPEPKPKPQVALTPKARELRKKLSIALRRARWKTTVIEGEELLHDPELAEAVGIDEFEMEMEA